MIQLALRGLVLLACLFAPSAAAGGDVRRLPVLFHVADSAQHTQPPEPFIARQLANANLVFAPLGLAFYDAGRAPLGEPHAVLVTRRDRDALLPLAKAGAVHCAVVAKLMDVDEPGRERRGVHWHGERPLPHLVILSTLAGDYVLAHELGHYFGNPEHSDTPGNLMSYLPGVVPPVLTPAQSARVLRSVRRLLRSGALR